MEGLQWVGAGPVRASENAYPRIKGLQLERGRLCPSENVKLSFRISQDS